MTGVWTDPADYATNDVITAAQFDALVGDTGNLQYLYEQIQQGLGAQLFVEGARYRTFFGAGPPASNVNYPNGTAAVVGMGCAVLEDTTSATVSQSTVAGKVGLWSFSTGATSGQNAGLKGPRFSTTGDWTMVWRGSVPSAASQTFFMGAKTTVTGFADENTLIGFRISATGNIIGVVDNAGTETTRDTGVTGASEHTLRIEVSSGGTIVRFYIDNVQVGADVTTNIPSADLYAMCGIVNSTTADKLAYTADWFGWQEV